MPDAPLCACGCKGPVGPARGGGWNRYINSHHTKHRNGIGFELPDTKASRPAGLADLYWSAGFLEGEGSFGGSVKDWGVLVEIACQQAQEEPLQRLREVLGGRVHALTDRPGRKPIWSWKVSGTRARGVMLTLFVLMSPRRQDQIVHALTLRRYA